MRGANAPFRQGGESFDLAVEPAVVVRLDPGDFLAHEHAADEPGDVLDLEAALGLELGTIEEAEILDLGRLGDVGIDRSRVAFVDGGIVAKRLEQPLAVADRPDQLDLLHLVVGTERVEMLAEGFEIDRLVRVAHPCDRAAQAVDGSVIVGDPEAAQPGVPVGFETGPLLLRENFKGRGGRGPESLLGPVQRLVEPLLKWLRQALRGRRQLIRILEPG